MRRSLPGQRQSVLLRCESSSQGALKLSQVKTTGIVQASKADLFHYTDWCYNVPEWFPTIRKTWIVKLPDSTGMGKVTRYVGTIFGHEIEWEAESVRRRENEVWAMRAISGPPAKMDMQLELRFETAGSDKTSVTCMMNFNAPYPVIGALIDWFYVRSEAVRLINNAMDGMKAVAISGKVPPIGKQIEKRKTDHPGYTNSSPPAFSPIISKLNINQKLAALQTDNGYEVS